MTLVTTDAGNTSCGNAGKVVALGLDYFMQVKSPHGEIHAEAKAALRHHRKSRAHASVTDTQNGQVVTYHAWRYDLGDGGWLDWTHARQLVRIQRTAECQRTGEVTVGNRYYVTSRAPDALSSRTALATCRAQWRCENKRPSTQSKPAPASVFSGSLSLDPSPLHGARDNCVVGAPATPCGARRRRLAPAGARH